MNATASPLLFDRALLRRHIARAGPHFAQHDALFNDTQEQILDRLADVSRNFTNALDLSPFPFLAARIFNESLASRNLSDSASPSNKDEIRLAPIPPPCRVTDTHTYGLIDEEALPFAPESFDLITNNLGLHWVNDVPGALTQIRTILKPDGLFIASLIGEQSLRELRSCLIDAEILITGGISPRVSPTIDLQTASQLMQRAGFTLPVADKETVTLVYADMFALMRELRGMGQTNALAARLRTPTRRAVFLEAARLYHERFSDCEGHIAATFDIIYLHGWK